eukprot:12937926-Prorocentrum_lima.AAC.1
MELLASNGPKIVDVEIAAKGWKRFLDCYGACDISKPCKRILRQRDIKHVSDDIVQRVPGAGLKCVNQLLPPCTASSVAEAESYEAIGRYLHRRRKL